MGRTPDDPLVQDAKGHPGKRKVTVKARQEEALRVAALLAATPGETADVVSPPKFLNKTDKRFAPALEVWKQLAPRLKDTHRLGPMHRLTFAIFCVAFAEWVSANEDIVKNGYHQTVPTTGGLGHMERMRPAVKIREMAKATVLDLSKLFGLTPADEYALMKDMRLAALNNPGLFGDGSDTQSGAGAAPHDGEPAQSHSVVGGLAAYDSPPPAVKVN